MTIGVGMTQSVAARAADDAPERNAPATDTNADPSAESAGAATPEPTTETGDAPASSPAAASPSAEASSAGTGDAPASPPNATGTAGARAEASDDGASATVQPGRTAVNPFPAATKPSTANPEREAASTPPQLVRKRSVPPFWIDRTWTTHRTRALAFPPVFVHRTPAATSPEKLLHVDLSFTFGWYAKAKERRRYINPLFLFFGGYSERKTTWAALPLLMGYRRVGEQYNFGQFPFVWAWGTKLVKNLAVVPFHYQQKKPDGRQAVTALLFWYGHKNLQDDDRDNDRKHFVAAPVFWRFQRGVKRFDFAFLYLGGQHRGRGTRYGAVLPVAFWRSTGFGNHKEVWSLPWIRRKNELEGRSAWGVPPLLTFRHHDPKRTIFSATPLVWHATNVTRASTFTLAGPFGWYRDPQQSNLFVAPLFYRFRDKTHGATTQLFLPLGWSRKTPERTAVWTLLGGGRKTAQGWGFGVPWALTFATKRDDGSRLGVYAGLLWHAARPARAGQAERDTWAAGPLAYYDRRGAERHLGLTPLLSFFRWGPERAYQVVTPLFWHVHDKAAGKRTVVLGPFYHRKDRAGFDGGLAPLAFWGNNGKHRYGVVPWLLTGHVQDLQAKTKLTISPLFVHHRGPRTRTLGVLGLAWDVRREDERHTAVFPFVYRGRNTERTVVATPIGGHVRRGDSLRAFYALVARHRGPDGSGFGVLPLFYHARRKVDGGWARTTTVPPLVVHHRSPSYDLDMWSPLVWRSNVRGDRPRRGLAVVPFYFRQRQPKGVDVDAGLGFFWSRDAVRRTHTLVVGPGFHRLSRKQLNAGIAPLYWWMDSQEKRRLIALPAIVHVADKKKHEHTTIAIPLWFDRKRSETHRTWAAFPFVFGGRRGHNFTRVSLVPLGYFDVFRLKRNTRFTGFVPLLFRYEKCGFKSDDDPRCRYRLWGSFPFFLYGKDGLGRRTHASILHYWDKRPDDGYKLYTPLFGVRHSPGKVLGWYAGIVGAKTTNTHRRFFAFPLVYHRAHRTHDESVTVAVPPLFVRRNRRDRKFFEAGLVVWQVRRPHKVSTAVLPPLFFYSHAYAERKLLWLAPFFVRDHQISKDLAWTAVPILYTQRRKGDDFDYVQFPLVWHIERGENQGTMGAFVWWDIRVRGKIFQTVPALYFRWSTPEQDTRIIGPGLGWWTRGKGIREGDHGWRMLWGFAGGGVEQGRRYAVFFGRKFDRGPQSAAAQARWEARQARRDARETQRRARAEQRWTAVKERQEARDRANAERRAQRVEEQEARRLAREARHSRRLAGKD